MVERSEAVCNEKVEGYEQSEVYNTYLYNSHAAELMGLIVGDIPPEHYRKMINDGNKPGRMAFSQMYFAALFGFGIFMACIFIIVAVIILIKRCFSPPKQYKSGILGIIIALVLLLISIGVMVFAAILLLRNSQLSRQGADQLPKNLNRDIFSVSAPLQIHARNVICYMDLKSLVPQIEKRLDNSSNHITDNALRNFMTIRGSEVFNAIGKLKQDALGLQKSAGEISIQNVVTVMKKVSTEFLEKIYITELEAVGKMRVFEAEAKTLPTHFQKINRKMLEVFQNFLQVLQELVRNVKDVEEKVKLYLIGSGVASSASYLLLGIWFPIMIVAMCTYAIVALIMRIYANHKNGLTFDEKMPSRGKLSRTSAELIGAFAYITIIFGAILFIMFSLGLFFGFGVMVSAKGLFADLNVFEKSILSMRTNSSENTVDIKLMDVFARCEKGEKLYSAVGLDELLTPQRLRMILKSSIQESDFNQIFLKNLEEHKSVFANIFTASQDINDTLSKTDFSAYRKAISKPIIEFRNAISEIAVQAKEVVQKISYVQNGHSQIVDWLTDALESTIKELVEMYAGYVSQVKQESGGCANLNAYRPILDEFLYARVAAPAQGQWMACLIAAIFSIFAFCGLLMTTKHLRNFAPPETPSEVEEMNEEQTSKNQPDAEGPEVATM
ncbi:hypothetical protein RB195_012147 [Necator americanus]|uniref:Prominin n=1 Tax=Necator americanus TaxID=51031 RepID=A0ABR1D8X0_NECAM